MIKNQHDYNEEVIQPIIKKVKQRSFSDYLDASIIIMVVGLFSGIVFTFLVDFIFSGNIDWKDSTVNGFIITGCSTAIYLLLRTYAMRKGRKTKAWTEASIRLEVIGKEIISRDCAKYISKYCRAWEEERFNNDIEDALACVGITLKEYKEKYAKLTKHEIKILFPELTVGQFKTIIRAKRIKRLKFDERYFFVNATVGKRRRSPSGGLTAQQINRITEVRMVITTVILSLVTASLLRDIILDLSAESIVKCVVKLAITIFCGAMGMIGGYSHSSVRESSEMNAKSDEIDVFLKWCVMHGNGTVRVSDEA